MATAPGARPPRPGWSATLVAALVTVAAVALAACGTPTARPSATTTDRPSVTTTTIAGSTGSTGSTGPATGPPGSTPTTPPGTPDVPCGVVPAAGVTIVPGTGTCQVTAVVGATVQLRLDTGFDWGDPTSDSASVRVEDVRRSVGGGLDAGLVVVAPGRATVSATGTVACAPGRACPALARLWRVEVDAAPG